MIYRNFERMKLLRFQDSKVILLYWKLPWTASVSSLQSNVVAVKSQCQKLSFLKKFSMLQHRYDDMGSYITGVMFRKMSHIS